MYASTARVEDIPEDQLRPMDRTIGKKDPVDASTKPAEDELLELADEPVAKVSFWYNGNKVNQEEFEERIKELEKRVRDALS